MRPPTVIPPLVVRRSADFAETAGASRSPETVRHVNDAAAVAPSVTFPETVANSRSVNVRPAGSTMFADTPWMTSAPRNPFGMATSTFRSDR